MQEIWKPIVGYENLYEISNLGNVRRQSNGNCLKPILLKNGYYSVNLSKNGKPKMYYVHRLVALHFVENPNPSRFNIVNHKDECKTNNSFENLEWCDITYNFSYGSAQERANSKKKGVYNTKCSKPIEGFNDDNEVIFIFPSLMEAHRHGFDYRLISACCLGKRFYHKGLHWRFANA